jgi:glutamyl-tRNA synthetase
MSARGRFAPSPTGALHLGSAAAAVLAWASARSAGGRFVLRIEDLDAERMRPGLTDAMIDDLRWLGLSWDEGPDCSGPHEPYVQSLRGELYAAAIELLDGKGLLYPCDCSRAEIRRVASAPHAGDEGPRYPGTCRYKDPARRDHRRPPGRRLAVPTGARQTIHDRARGRIEEVVSEQTGDFVLQRGDGVYAYQLAVVVDDLAMGITEVVRGVDLIGSAPRQAMLARLLGGVPPETTHVPLVVGIDGERLAKRAAGVPIGEQRRGGRDPRDLVRRIARAYGQPVGDAADPLAALAEVYNPRMFPDVSIPVARLTSSGAR